jgi:hypothetical protein
LKARQAGWGCRLELQARLILDRYLVAMAPSGGRACGGVGASCAESAGDISGSLIGDPSCGSRGRDNGSAANGGAGGLGVSFGDDVGGEQHPSSCGIGLFLAETVARLLARVTSLAVFTRFRGGGAGCSDNAGGGVAGCDGWESSDSDGCGDWESGDDGATGCGDLVKAVGGGIEAVGVSACLAVAGSAVAESSSALDVVWRLGCER